MAAVGFTGGDKLQKRLRNIIAKLDGPDTVSVGFLEGSTYPDGTSIPLVAATQEFGSTKQGIPPRPFFRGMIAAKADTWAGEIAASMKATDCAVAKTLGYMGDLLKADLVQSIHDTNDPPLKPATVKRKGFDKPLIDKGDMWKSVDYEVNE